MNWGTKITVLYSGFVILIVSMVSMAMREKVDLVSADYYEQELKYQDKIDQMENSNGLLEPFSWEVRQDVILLKFPGEFKGKVKGAEIHFFRPSDKTLDQQVSMPSDTAQLQHVETAKFRKGIYRMEVSWEAEDRKFYNEGIIQIH